MVRATAWPIGLVGNCLVNGISERKTRHAVDGSKMAIRHAYCVASVDLALSGTVHVNDSAVAVSEIDSRVECIQCSLNTPNGSS